MRRALLALLLPALLAAGGCSKEPPAPSSARAVSAERDWILGPADAPISLIVYSDAECPFCKAYAGTAEEIAAMHQGGVNVVLRHFPLDRHGPAAIAAAVATECVGAQAGPQAAVSFFYGHMGITQGDGQGLPSGEASLLALAKTSGARDLAAFRACLSHPEAIERVRQDLADGRAAGVKSTPSTLIRFNKPGAVPDALLEGNLPPAELAKAISSTLQSALAADRPN